MTKELVPILLLTGFLGSGKTTLLNYLLKQPEMANTLVIINEFGDIGLDHLLVTHSTENQEILEISAGCICCNLRSDLKKTLKDIGWRFSRNGKKHFDRVLIETTGLADPAPVLHTIMTDEYMTAHYRLDGVVATFDAFNGLETLNKHYEAVKQLAIADCIIMTKTDLISQAFLPEIDARILAINPAAKRYEVQHGILDCEKLLNLSLLQKLLENPLSDNHEYAKQISHWLRSDYYLNFSHPVQHLDEGSHYHDDIYSFSFSLDAPITPKAFNTFLELLKELQGHDLLRIKGIINLTDRVKPLVFHAVQHVFHPLIELPDWPDLDISVQDKNAPNKYVRDKRTHLVFITHNISRETLENLIERAFGNQHNASKQELAELASTELPAAKLLSKELKVA